jgi:hypothetical protein
MDARTPVDETSGPPGGQCTVMLQLSFFGNPSPQHAHRRISQSLLQSHGFVARDPFDPAALLSLVHSDEFSSLCLPPFKVDGTNSAPAAHFGPALPAHEVVGKNSAPAAHFKPASPTPEVDGTAPAPAAHVVPASPAPSAVVD